MTRESIDELRERLLRDGRVLDMIRQRAYEIYQLRGGAPGHEAEDWFQAEHEVIAFLIDQESRNAAESAASAEPSPQAAEEKPKKAASKKAASTKTAASRKKKAEAQEGGEKKKASKRAADKKPARAKARKPKTE